MDRDAVDAILARTRRIAVLGIKTEAQRGQPAFDVPEYMQRAGFEIVPVPVYYPDVTEILGQPVYRRLVDVPGELDLVDVFRRAKDIEAHMEDILTKRPSAVWFQLGIWNDAAAKKIEAAGIPVVQNLCLMVEHARWAAAGGKPDR
jgi:hypothetical protein